MVISFKRERNSKELEYDISTGDTALLRNKFNDWKPLRKRSCNSMQSKTPSKIAGPVSRNATLSPESVVLRYRERATELD